MTSSSQCALAGHSAFHKSFNMAVVPPTGRRRAAQGRSGTWRFVLLGVLGLVVLGSRQAAARIVDGDAAATLSAVDRPTASLVEMVNGPTPILSAADQQQSATSMIKDISDTNDLPHGEVSRFEPEVRPATGMSLSDSVSLDASRLPPPGQVDRGGPKPAPEHASETSPPFVRLEDITAKMNALATLFSAQEVSWNSSYNGFGTPEGNRVARFDSHTPGAYVQFQFTAPVTMKATSVYLTGGRGTMFESRWSIQYRRSCVKPILGDRWIDAVPMTTKLKRGHNKFTFNPPELLKGRDLYSCWRWVLLDNGGANAVYTEYRWYPSATPLERRMNMAMERLLSCKEQGWKPLKVDFPWAEVGGPVQYNVDCDGIVRLRGLVGYERRELDKLKYSQPPPIVTLPEAARPSQWAAFPVATGKPPVKIPGAAGSSNEAGKNAQFDIERKNGFVGVVYLQTDGQLVARTFDWQFISLDGVAFTARSADDQWEELQFSDPFLPFFRTHISYRSDSNGLIWLRGSVATSRSDAKQATKNVVKKDPFSRTPAAAQLSPLVWPTRITRVPCATGNVHSAEGLKDLRRIYDAVVKPVVPGAIQIGRQGHILPRVFNPDFVSLDGIAYTAPGLDSQWKKLDLMAPWQSVEGPVQWRTDPDGNVYLRGAVTVPASAVDRLRYDSSPSPIAALPPSAPRPVRDTVVVVTTGWSPPKGPKLYDGRIKNEAAGLLYVLQNGVVLPVDFDVVFIVLDNVRFSSVK